MSLSARTLDSLTRRFRSARVRARLRIDLPRDPGATKNIVPVDWVAESMIRLVERDDSRRVYHLTHPEPIPHDGLARILSEVFQLPGLRLVPPGGDPSSPSSPSRATQQCVNGILGEYFPYLQGEPTFDRRAAQAATGILIVLAALSLVAITTVDIDHRPLEFLPVDAS